MIKIYCQGHHAVSAGICDACKELEQYALKRLECCPYGNDKPPCVNCPIHCYKKDMRESVREVMRFSGPRMLFKHPILAGLHLWGMLNTKEVHRPPSGRK